MRNKLHTALRRAISVQTVWKFEKVFHSLRACWIKQLDGRAACDRVNHALKKSRIDQGEGRAIYKSSGLDPADKTRRHIITIKSATGKIELTLAELQRALRDLALTVIPFTAQHALRMFSLPIHHRDPFDRMIIATALTEGIALVGGHSQFKVYKDLNVIW